MEVNTTIKVINLEGNRISKSLIQHVYQKLDQNKIKLSQANLSQPQISIEQPVDATPEAYSEPNQAVDLGILTNPIPIIDVKSSQKDVRKIASKEDNTNNPLENSVNVPKVTKQITPKHTKVPAKSHTNEPSKNLCSQKFEKIMNQTDIELFTNNTLYTASEQVIFQNVMCYDVTVTVTDVHETSTYCLNTRMVGGVSGGGPTVLLLHGFGNRCTFAAWSKMIEPLHKENYDVLFIDLPGNHSLP